ncbi:hypothetical protein HPGCJGGD_1952 [Methylobacterium haplocladii]|nr:hypothetical protein HPGCJGGD_1952 [Methylobacterium haplocladii]
MRPLFRTGGEVVAILTVGEAEVLMPNRPNGRDIERRPLSVSASISTKPGRSAA